MTSQSSSSRSFRRQTYARRVKGGKRSRTPSGDRAKSPMTGRGLRSSTLEYEYESMYKVRRSLIWALVLGSFAVVSYQLGNTLNVQPILIGTVVLLGTVSFPIQTSIFVIVASVISQRVSMRDVAFQVVPVLSASLGLALLIVSKFAPYWLIRGMNWIGGYYSDVYHMVLDFIVPWRFRVAGGVVYTGVSELLLIPAIAFLLSGVAQLKYAGEDFNTNLNRTLGAKRRRGSPPQVVLVFVHGNEFNECQWLFGRMYLMSRSFSRHLEFVSVNMFSGLMMRSHTRHTITVRGCAMIAMEQIQEELKKRDLQPKHIILMGHSLGGVVAAYIKEYLAKETSLPVELVVSWSAPLAGSGLLLWAKTHLPFLNSRLQHGIMNDFCPTAHTTLELRKRMLNTEMLHPGTYCALTGSCDPLVRPASSLPTFLQEGNKKLIAHLGHYNIKVSLKAWAYVAEWIRIYLQSKKMT